MKLCMAKMTGSVNHSIKQVPLAKEEVKRSGQEEPFLLQAEMEVELAEEVQMKAKEVFGKPTMDI